MVKIVKENGLIDLKTVGLTLEWVRLGNEITAGLLFIQGRTTNMSQLTQLLKRKYDATKSIDTAIKVITHLNKGNNSWKFRNFFDNATAYNLNYSLKKYGTV